MHIFSPETGNYPSWIKVGWNDWKIFQNQSPWKIISRPGRYTSDRAPDKVCDLTDCLNQNEFAISLFWFFYVPKDPHFRTFCYIQISSCWCIFLMDVMNWVNTIAPVKVHFFNQKVLGPVVQSVISLTSSLRVISLTVLADSIHNIQIFFAEKMWVAFALQKLLTFYQQTISAYLRITRLKF